MRFLVFISFVSVLCFIPASSLLEDGDVTNLFVDSESFPLFSDSDDANGLSADFADPTLDQISLADDNSNTLDWTDSVELAGVDDFCAADGETQIIGKMRARDNHRSCGSSSQNVNLLKIPGIPNLFDVFRKGKKPSAQPGSEIENEPPLAPLIPTEENVCKPPNPEHLCCASPGYNSLSIVQGQKFHNTMEGCTPGTYPDEETPLIYAVYFVSLVNFDAALAPGSCQSQYEVCCASYFV